MQQTTWSRQHGADNMQETTCCRYCSAQRAVDNMQQTTCSRQRGADNVRPRKCSRRYGADTIDAAEMQRTTCGGQRRSTQHAADTMQRTTCSGEQCSGHSAAHSVQRRTYNSQRVCQWRRSRWQWHACARLCATQEGPPASSWPPPPPAPYRHCVRAFRASWQRAADNGQRGDPSCSRQQPGHRIGRGRAIIRRLANRRIREQANTCDAREHRRRAADDVPQAPCRTATGSGNRAAETEQQQQSRRTCSRHAEWNGMH
jgi:hypothetical protein